MIIVSWQNAESGRSTVCRVIMPLTTVYELLNK